MTTVFRRTSRGASYLAFAIGSYFSVLYPSEVISDLANPDVSRVFSVLFAISASICLLSVILNNWVVESIGLPMLCTVFFMYSVCGFASIHEGSPSIIAFAFVVLGISVHLFSRHRELAGLLKDVKKEKLP